MVALERGAPLLLVHGLYAFDCDRITDHAVDDIAEAMGFADFYGYFDALEMEGRKILERLP